MGDDARLLPTQMRMKSTQSALAFFTFLSCAILCVANTEKTIFLGPANINFPNVSPSLSELELYYLTPNHSSLRLELPRSFPNSTHPRGLQSWYILDNLLAGQRYEVRVCWLATEPTEFWLDTYTINQVFASPSLISLVSSFSESQIDRIKPTPNTQVPLSFVGNRSILLLHIQAAADYFTTNVTLMKEPPAVLADIILDPFIFNIFPRSLGPTAVFISCIACASWFIAGWIWKLLFKLTRDEKAHAD